MHCSMYIGHVYVYAFIIVCLVNVYAYDDKCILQINEFVKRARAAKIHAYIISHLKKEMPSMMGKAKAQQRLIDNLEDEFGKVCLLIYFNLLLFLNIFYIY